MDCFENALRCFGIGGRVPSIYVQRPFPFKHTVYRMEIQSTWFKTPIPTIGLRGLQVKSMRSRVLFCCEISKNVNSNSAEEKIYTRNSKRFFSIVRTIWTNQPLQVWSRHAVEKGAVDAQPGLVDTLAFLNGIYEYLEV